MNYLQNNKKFKSLVKLKKHEKNPNQYKPNHIKNQKINKNSQKYQTLIFITQAQYTLLFLIIINVSNPVEKIHQVF